MNKVVTIHLDGIAYSLEEGAFDALRAYLDSAKLKLAQNPDKDEIIKDLEQAIGSKLNAYLSAHKNVVTLADVEVVLAEMGPVAAEGEEAAAGSESGQKSEDAAPHKRLYKIREGAWLAGVCNGIAAYFNIDVSLVRILFVLFTMFSHGFGIFVYILLALFIPVARTPKEYEWASGVEAITAQELVDRAKKSVEDFANSGEWQNWKQHLQQQRNAWKHQRKAWKRANKYAQKYNWKAEQYRHRPSVVSEIFGIACATLVISFTLWYLYGHVTLVHDFFNALHNLYVSFIANLAQLVDRMDK